MAALEKVAKVQRSLSLRLYKAILASHRQLPPEMRLIGDLYVREEFQRHKTAKPEHLRPFFEQWLQYLEQMKDLDLASNKHDLPDEVVVNLSDEQRDNLWKMRRETDRIFGGAINAADLGMDTLPPELAAQQNETVTALHSSPPIDELDVVGAIINAPLKTTTVKAKPQ